jgi:hypothetical protein
MSAGGSGTILQDLIFSIIERASFYADPEQDRTHTDRPEQNAWAIIDREHKQIVRDLP